MKSNFKFALLLAGVGGVAALGLWGVPKLLAASEFEKALQADSVHTLSAGPDGVAETCNLCHGVNGNPVSSYYPRLAGQSSAYILQQLESYAAGRRKSPQMAPMAIQLSATERKQIADYYAGQEIVRHVTAQVADVNAAAPPQAAAQCASCHGPALEGGEAAPRIAGQGAVYVARQMRAFRSHDRMDPTGAMNGIAAPMSDADIVVLAAYVGTR